MFLQFYAFYSFLLLNLANHFFLELSQFHFILLNGWINCWFILVQTEFPNDTAGSASGGERALRELRLPDHWESPAGCVLDERGESGVDVPRPAAWALRGPVRRDTPDWRGEERGHRLLRLLCPIRGGLIHCQGLLGGVPCGGGPTTCH